MTQYYPTGFTVEDLAEATTASQIAESLLAEALERTTSATPCSPAAKRRPAPVEREVMLQIIDQRWRDHLAEMDYLREGINLRAMGQQDPLVAWQREGFEMFGQMMDAIDDDYLRYVMHVQVVAEPAPEPDLSQASYQAADDPVQGASLLEAMRGTVSSADVAAAGEGVPLGLDEGGMPVPGGPGVAPAPGRRGDPGTPGEGPHREARAQRAVLVRERQEVQALPWRGLSRPGPATSATSGASWRRSANASTRPRAT